jgi:hypothetical protein
MNFLQPITLLVVGFLSVSPAHSAQTSSESSSESSQSTSSINVFTAATSSDASNRQLVTSSFFSSTDEPNQSRSQPSSSSRTSSSSSLDSSSTASFISRSTASTEDEPLLAITSNYLSQRVGPSQSSSQPSRDEMRRILSQRQARFIDDLSNNLYDSSEGDHSKALYDLYLEDPKLNSAWESMIEGTSRSHSQPSLSTTTSTGLIPLSRFDFGQIRERQLREESLNTDDIKDMMARITILGDHPYQNLVITLDNGQLLHFGGSPHQSVLESLQCRFNLEMFERIRPVSNNGEVTPIQSYEVFAWLVNLRQNRDVASEQLRQLVGPRSISQETFNEAIFAYSRINGARSIFLSEDPFNLVVSTSQVRLLLELSFHGLTNIYNWANDNERLEVRNELLNVIINTQGHDNLNSRSAAYVEYFMNRGFLLDPNEILQIGRNNGFFGQHTYANLLLHRGESITRLPFTPENLGYFAHLDSERQRQFRSQVGARLTPAIAAIVLKFAGYMEAHVEHEGDPRKSGSERLVLGPPDPPPPPHWLYRGVVAAVSWLFSCPTKLICRGKRSKTS